MPETPVKRVRLEEDEVEIWEDSVEVQPVPAAVPPSVQSDISSSKKSSEGTNSRSMVLSKSASSESESTETQLVRHSTPVKPDETWESLDCSPIPFKVDDTSEAVELSGTSTTSSIGLGTCPSGNSSQFGSPPSGLNKFSEDSDPNIVWGTPSVQAPMETPSVRNDSSIGITRSRIERGMEDLDECEDHYVNGSPETSQYSPEPSTPISSRLRDNPRATDRYGHPNIAPRRNAPRERKEPDRLGINIALMIELMRSLGGD